MGVLAFKLPVADASGSAEAGLAIRPIDPSSTCELWS